MSQSSSESGEECPICLESLDSAPAVALLCSHLLHHLCLFALTDSESNRERHSCPICREPISPYELKLLRQAMAALAAPPATQTADDKVNSNNNSLRRQPKVRTARRRTDAADPNRSNGYSGGRICAIAGVCVPVVLVSALVGVLFTIGVFV